MARSSPGDNRVFNANVDNFDGRVLKAPRQHPVLVGFWAEWCAPCLVIAPVLVELVGEYAGVLELARVEVDVGENMKLAGRYQVRGFPTVILFRDAEEQGRFSGAQSLSRMRDFIMQHGGIQ